VAGAVMNVATVSVAVVVVCSGVVVIVFCRLFRVLVGI